MPSDWVETDHPAHFAPDGVERLLRTASVGVSLLFSKQDLPSADAIEALLASGEAGAPMARISHRPVDDPSWLELLASGLTFDMSGLAGAERQPPCEPRRDFRHAYGFENPLDPGELEAVELVPGGHIAGGSAMPPVVRTLVGLAAGLALQMPVVAVGWHSAGTVMAPAYFARMVMNWLRGGAFPALGLAALIESDDGTIASQGLTTFSGQEFQIQPGAAKAGADSVKLALRIADHIVRHGPITEPGPVDGVPGLYAEPSRIGKRVWIWRQD